MTLPVRFDDATLEDIQRRFREGRPNESSKRKRHSRCDLIRALHTDIERLLADGYSYDGIAEYLRSLDVVIRVATLKNYLGRARRKVQSTRNRATSSLEGNASLPRSPKKRSAKPAAQPSTPSPPTAAPDTGAAAAHAPPTNERAPGEPPTDVRGPEAERSSQAPPTALPLHNDTSGGNAGTALPPPSATDPSQHALQPPDAPAVEASTARPSPDDEAPQEGVASTAASSAHAPSAGSREEGNASVSADRADVGTTTLAMLRSRASPIKNAFTPRTLRLDKDL